MYVNRQSSLLLRHREFIEKKTIEVLWTGRRTKKGAGIPQQVESRLDGELQDQRGRGRGRGKHILETE